MQFTFPEQNIPNFNRFQQIKSFINNLLNASNLSTYCHYKFKMIKNQYIYCICRQCQARLVFKKENDIYQIFKARLKHKHREIRQRRQHIIQTIRNYPSCFNINTIKKMTLARYQISTPTFYRYLRLSKQMGKDIDSVLTMLESDGIFGVKIGSDLQGQFPSILLLTCEIMIKKYIENRKIVKFDLTYNIIREKAFGDKQFAVGVFVTQNNNMNIDPVGLVIMEDETKQSFIRVFTQFFYLMKEPPDIIITDQQRTMKFALEELKERGIFKGEHLVDLFHILRNVKKAIFYKPHLNSFVALSRSCHLLQYGSRRRGCLNNITGRDLDLLATFEEKLQKCCIAQIPSVFVGLSCSTNSVQKINDIIKQKIPFSQNYVTVVGQLSKLLIGIVNKIREPNLQKMRAQQFSVIPQIKELRSKLCKRVFRRLMLQLSLSSTCLVSMTSNPNIFLIQQENFEENESYAVQFSNIKGSWICQCELSLKIGIPCMHIIKILILRKQKLISAINSWWILEDQPLIINSKKDKPRKTRRHRL